MNGRHYVMLTLDGDYWVFDRANAGEKIVGQEKDSDSIAQIRRMPYEKGVFNRLEIVIDDSPWKFLRTAERCRR